MKQPKSYEDLMAMRQLALEDLMLQSDAQLRLEAAADGEDIDAIAAEVRASLHQIASSLLRQRLLNAKQLLMGAEPRQNKRAAYPALETIKRRIESAFQSQPELGLAFREGKSQSERDWQSLYDDLIELGAIDPDRDDT